MLTNRLLRDMNKTSISNFSRVIVRMLVDGQYSELERISGGNRLPAELLEQSVEEYGRTLVMPPEKAFDNIDVIEVEGSSPKQYSVSVDLYSMEEGKSDLSLEMTLIEKSASFDVEIDNIHVL